MSVKIALSAALPGAGIPAHTVPMNEACEGRSREQRLKWWAIAVTIGVVGLYLAGVARLAVDFPYWDDYYSVLEGVCKFHAADSGAEKTAVLLSQHNEHRVALLRGAAVADCAAQGHVDFRTLIWMGNAGLLAFCALLMVGARRSIRSAALLALIPLALLSPIQEKQMVWATCVLSNYCVLALAAGAMLLVTARGWGGFGGACVLALAATFTMGQGIFCFGVGAAMLAMERQWRRAGVWLGVMVAAALVYFHHYSRPSYHPPPELTWTTVQFFPVAVGGAVSDMTCRFLAPVFEVLGWESALVPTIQMGAGVVLIGLVVWLGVKGYYRRNLFVSGFLVYLVGLCAVASVSRSGFGLQHALMSHYKVISMSIAVLVALGLAEMRWGSGGSPDGAILSGGVLVCLLSWSLFYPGTRAYSRELADGRARFVGSQDARGVFQRALREEGVDILWRSYLTGVLRLEDLDQGAGATLSVERLARLGARRNVSLAEARSAVISESGRVVASLARSGQDLRVRRVLGASEIGDGAGMIWVVGGRLQYVLPEGAGARD